MLRQLLLWLCLLLGLAILSCNENPTANNQVMVSFENPYVDAILKNTATVDVFAISEKGDTILIYTGVNKTGPWEKQFPKGSFTLVIVQKDANGTVINTSKYDYTFKDDVVQIQAKIEISPRTLTLHFAQAGVQFNFKIFPSSTPQVITWLSRNPAIAEINSSGLLVPKSVGKVQILAQFTGIKSDSIEVNIVDTTSLNVLPVQITKQPQKTVALVEDDSVTLSVLATGSDLKYEWKANGAALPGATNAELHIDSAKVAQNGIRYVCRVYNSIYQVISDTAVVTVSARIVKPIISNQPVSVKATTGTRATFRVVALGKNLTYQWYRNDAAIAGAIDSEFVINGVTASMDGERYYVTVSNPVAKVNSDTVQLTFSLTIEKPLITTHPLPVQISEGGVASFDVIATGTNLQYLWFKNDVTLVGETGSRLTFAAKIADSGTYYTCRVSNTGGTVISTKAYLTVHKVVFAPKILTSPPVSIKVTEGQSVKLTVTAEGTDLKYRWFKNNIILVGSDSAVYQTSILSIIDDGSIFKCKVYNSKDSVFSPDAKLVIDLIAPVIQAPPASADKTVGQTVVFSVKAVGTNLKYQWLKNAVPILNATNSTFTTDALVLADSGAQYTVEVSNTGGKILSAPGILKVGSVIVPPKITTSPAAIINKIEGQIASFTVVAEGTDLKFQWLKDGVNLAGEVGSTYQTGVLSIADDGAKFKCTVTNSLGAVTTTDSKLMIELIAPIITSQPTSSLVKYLGETAIFSVVATGTNKTYQWFKGTTALTGETKATLTLANVTVANAGDYSVTVTNTKAAITSIISTLLVRIKPSITTQPAPTTVYEGTKATFNVLADGTAPLIYQWLKNGVTITGANSTGYTTGLLASGDDGDRYSVSVTSGPDNVVSADAILTVRVKPSIKTQPVSVTVYEGATNIFSVVAAGTGPLGYQWFKNNAMIPGANQASYTTPAVTTSDNGAKYSVTVTSGPDNVVSADAILSVRVKPTITTQPISAAVNEGATSTFTVVAAGTGPLVYQWIKNSVNILGANSASYTTAATIPADNGNKYSVSVTSGPDNIVSAEAILTVKLKPVISSTSPSTGTVVKSVGSTVAFTVTATGFAPLTYVWKKGGTAVPGATSSSYTTPTLALGNKGDIYSVEVSNSVGTAISANWTLDIQDIVPAAPSGLTVVKNGTDTLTLTWTDNSNNEDGFYIERSLSVSANYTRIATTIPGATSYKDAGLTVATTYYYRVQSFNIKGASAYTNVASIKTWNCGDNFTDGRDGQSYPTVSFKGRCWMKQNMNFGISGETKCLNDDVAKCTEYKQKWYTLAGSSQACPSNFILPTQAEFSALFSPVGWGSCANPNAINGVSGTEISSLLSTSGKWDSYIFTSNASGLSFEPAGSYGYGAWSNEHYGGYHWLKSSTEAITFTTETNWGCTVPTSYRDGDLNSVRCIKN